MLNFKDKIIVGPHNHPLSLDSGNSVKQFIKSAAQDFGRKAIALTDHGTMGSIIEAIDYSKELKKKDNLDIKIIPGIELYLLPSPDDDSKMAYYHVTVHFNDFDAYLAGCELSKSSYDRAVFKGGELKPLVTWEELESLSGKVTLFSSCLVGAVSRPWIIGRKDISERNFVRLMNIAGAGNFFAEIFPYEVDRDWNFKTKTFVMKKPTECCPSGKLQVDANKWIIELAKKYNIPVVISEDAHYAHKSEKFIQDARLNKDGRDSWKMSDANCLHHTDELYKEFSRIHPEYINETTFNEMIENSYKFEENFKGFESKFKPSLPKVIIDDKEVTGDNELASLVLNRIIKKGRIDLNNPIYRNRINKELQQLVFNGEINLIPYIWPLNRIVDFCEENDIMIGPGRGSAAGSLLSYSLGITSVDPIKEDLSFERFFDVTRVKEGLADIDTDFSDRNKVIDFIKSYWKDHFAYIGIGITFKIKSALKDIDRFLYGQVRKETEDICKGIPQAPQGVDEVKFLVGYTDADDVYHDGEVEKNQKLAKYLENNPQSRDLMFKMVGIIRQMSRHAAGVLIANRPIHSFIPIMNVSNEPTTQILPKEVEKCGGIKYDILGVSTLEDIRLCLKLIKQRRGLKIDPWKIEDSYDFWEACINDPTTVFQLHTPTVRNGLQTMRPHTVQEAAILTSVFRPGAMDAISNEDPSKTMDTIFLERWTGKRPVHYVHPELEKILGPTKGIIVYQEQVMRIVNELGGLTMPETNQLRKAISKKSGDALIKLLNKVQNNLITRGWTDEQARTVCDQMKASGRYCFNKSHAVSYCYIARACAYLKYHYSTEWWTAVLSNADKDDLRSHWSHVTVPILPPDINLSTELFQVIDPDSFNKLEKTSILSPLSMIEGVGPTVMGEVQLKRPFSSIQDMMSKVDRRIVNKGPMIKLVFSGVLDRFFNKDMKDHEKIQEYLNLKAKMEGKKTPEAVPIEYLNMTPLKNFLLKKGVFKVFSSNLNTIALPQLMTTGKAQQNGKNSRSYVFTGTFPERALIPLKRLESLIENKEEARSFAVIGYVVDTKDKLYQNNTKTALRIIVEIEDKTFEFMKWPGWNDKHHNIKDDLSESVCVLLMSRRKPGNDIFVDEIYVIENLNFLKEKENEPKPART